VPLAQVRAVVARNRAALARLRQGFGKKYLKPPATSPDPTLWDLSKESPDSLEPSPAPLPVWATYWELATVLLTEGKLAEREGHMADAARSYLDCLRLGTDVPRGGERFEGELGIAIEATALEAISRAVDRMDAPTALATAQAMLRLEQQAPGAADILQVEKVRGTEDIVRIYRETIMWQQVAQSGDASWVAGAVQDAFHIIKHGFTPRDGGIPRKRVLDEYRAYMDTLIAKARQPYDATSTPPQPPSALFSRLPSELVARMTVQTYNSVRLCWAQRDANWHILELRLAARAYTARHGVPPPSADALVPECLSAVTSDPFAGKPLVCRLKNGRALIYSRGPDGDDDGGRDLSGVAGLYSDGDIVSMRAPGMFGGG
jgi:hypothetical protein